jgi:hypothetical protein
MVFALLEVQTFVVRKASSSSPADRREQVELDRATLFLTDCSSQSKVYAGNFESFQRRSSVSFLRSALGDALCLQGFPGPRLSRPPPGMRSGLNSDCLNGGKDQVMRGTVVAAEYFEMHIKLAQASGVGWEKVRV